VRQGFRHDGTSRSNRNAGRYHPLFEGRLMTEKHRIIDYRQENHGAPLEEWAPHRNVNGLVPPAISVSLARPGAPNEN